MHHNRLPTVAEEQLIQAKWTALLHIPARQYAKHEQQAVELRADTKRVAGNLYKYLFNITVGNITTANKHKDTAHTSLIMLTYAGIEAPKDYPAGHPRYGRAARLPEIAKPNVAKASYLTLATYAAATLMRDVGIVHHYRERSGWVENPVTFNDAAFTEQGLLETLDCTFRYLAIDASDARYENFT